MNNGILLSARLATLRAIDDRVLGYISRVPPGFYIEAGPDRSAYSLLFRAHLLHALGAVPDEIRRTVDELAASQAADGFLEATEPVAGTVHDIIYLRLHKSALFFQLADLYGADVRAPDIERLFPVARLRAYLDGLDWRNIWLHSNTLLGLGSAADFSVRRGGADSHRDVLLDFFHAHAPLRGLWGEAEGASRLNAMAGTYHLIPLFLQGGRPLPSPEKLAGAVLSLQTDRGFFCAPSGYSCIEYDAAYLLWASRPLVDGELAVRITRSAESLFDAMARLQNSDGGFPEMGRVDGVGSALWDTLSSWKRHGDPATMAWHLKKVGRLFLQPTRPFLNNSTMACAARAHESNVFSTWLRYLTCCLAADLAGIRPFDSGRACRVVGLNYDPRPARKALE